MCIYTAMSPGKRIKETGLSHLSFIGIHIILIIGGILLSSILSSSSFSFFLSYPGTFGFNEI